MRRAAISLKKKAAMTVTRVSLGAEKLVYVLVADRADHLVAGSKEARIAAGVRHPEVLVVGTPFVDIWAAIRPKTAGIDAEVAGNISPAALDALRGRERRPRPPSGRPVRRTSAPSPSPRRP